MTNIQRERSFTLTTLTSLGEAEEQPKPYFVSDVSKVVSLQDLPPGARLLWKQSNQEVMPPKNAKTAVEIFRAGDNGAIEKIILWLRTPVATVGDGLAAPSPDSTPAQLTEQAFLRAAIAANRLASAEAVPVGEARKTTPPKSPQDRPSLLARILGL